jgi:hypothetical protein
MPNILAGKTKRVKREPPAKRSKLTAKRQSIPNCDSKSPQAFTHTAPDCDPAFRPKDCSVKLNNIISTDPSKEIASLRDEVNLLKIQLSSLLVTVNSIAPLAAVSQCLNPSISITPSEEDVLTASRFIDSLSIELHRRSQCVNGVLVFNVPDKTSLFKIKKELLNVCDMAECNCSCTRLRKKSQNKCCPILFQFGLNDDAKKFLNKHASMMSQTSFKTIRVSPNRTPIQRLLYKNSKTTRPTNRISPNVIASTPNPQQVVDLDLSQPTPPPTNKNQSSANRNESPSFAQKRKPQRSSNDCRQVKPGKERNATAGALSNLEPPFKCSVSLNHVAPAPLTQVASHNKTYTNANRTWPSTQKNWSSPRNKGTLTYCEAAKPGVEH